MRNSALYKTETIRINLWSGPRNISTALMYSFGQRNDTRILDEPLYGWYLQQTGLPHPGREEILASMECDGERVISEQLLGNINMPVLFAKQMTHHLLDLPKNFLLKGKNILLIRHPYKVLVSYNKVIQHPTLDDIGIRQSWELYTFLKANNAHVWIVDGDELLKNPAQQLSAICHSCGLAMDDNMLHWPAGARKEDGVWAKYWYGRVHTSTGFDPYIEKKEILPAHLDAVAEEGMKYYEALLADL